MNEPHPLRQAFLLALGYVSMIFIVFLIVRFALVRMELERRRV